jgi:hypothetical protein
VIDNADKEIQGDEEKINKLKQELASNSGNSILQLKMNEVIRN